MWNRLSQVTVRVVVASLLMMATLSSYAQIGKEPVEDAPESASWLAFVLALFFGAAIGLGCLMSPKRSHQD